LGLRNQDETVVRDFGREWSSFDQSEVTEEENRRAFDSYFEVFPWHSIGEDAEGFDAGCGSGRYAKLVAERVRTLHCVDASSEALEVARRNLAGFDNCQFHLASVDNMPMQDESMDFGYSLGVLHHVPDTQAGLAACVRKLKPGQPFLLYLYYRFDNRPRWFVWLWQLSNVLRKAISRMPFRLKRVSTDVIAALIYFPLSRIALIAERAGLSVESMPLSAYRHSSFYTLRTDALDRFGTTLEKRFTKAEILEMMENAGLENIRFGTQTFWTAVGYKK